MNLAEPEATTQRINAPPYKTSWVRVDTSPAVQDIPASAPVGSMLRSIVASMRADDAAPGTNSTTVILAPDGIEYQSEFPGAETSTTCSMSVLLLSAARVIMAIDVPLIIQKHKGNHGFRYDSLGYSARN